MIEIYVGLTLAGLGYILNQNRPVKSNPVKQLNPSEMMSNRNPYDSNFTQTARKIEENAARKKFEQAVKAPNPMTAPVVPKDAPAFVKSPLTGIEIPASEFKHNNMTPFYKGALKPIRLDGGGLAQNLETFTGISQFYQPKREVEQFFRPERNLGNVTGNAPNAGFIQNRVDAPKVRNNTLPFEQIRVGPAVGRGFTADPTGGFQQLDARDYAMPRTVDDLRAANKPKVSYKGRTVDGQKGSMRGEVGAVNKNRVPTVFEKTQDDLFRTTGAYLKNKQQPAVNAKYTARQDVSTKAYAGTAYKNTVGQVQHGEVSAPHKDQLGSLGIANPSLTHMPNQKGDDYGKGAIQIYDNERSVTTTRTYQGNVTSLVKSLIAPIEDLIKVTRKEYTVEAAREYGQMQATMPAKPTVYNPNAPMRTTIKETLIHDSTKLNLKGAPKITVYDPNAVTRTTIKETLLHDAIPTNVRSARTAPQAYTEHEARTTTRNTIAPIDPQRNMGTSGTLHAGVVYDPNSTARTTMKQTTVDQQRLYGNPDRAEGGFKGGYTEEHYDAPETQRHIIAQNSEYQGNPTQANGDAYTVVQDSSIPRETQKEYLTDHEYYGTAGDKTTHKPKSYEDAYNATIDELKAEMEMLTGERGPTLSGPKVAAGMEDVSLQTRKIDCDVDAQRAFGNQDNITNTPLDADRAVTLTKDRNQYIVDDRLDLDILNAFKDNEFTQPLDSVA